MVRNGSVRGAAAELGVSEAAVSGSVASLRKELDDSLFSPSRAGLVFTPGGLRLAQRAVEMLGLQAQTRREVHGIVVSECSVSLRRVFSESTQHPG